MSPVTDVYKPKGRLFIPEPLDLAPVFSFFEPGQVCKHCICKGTEEPAWPRWELEICIHYASAYIPYVNITVVQRSREAAGAELVSAPPGSPCSSSGWPQLPTNRFWFESRPFWSKETEVGLVGEVERFAETSQANYSTVAMQCMCVASYRKRSQCVHQWPWVEHEHQCEHWWSFRVVSIKPKNRWDEKCWPSLLQLGENHFFLTVSAFARYKETQPSAFCNLFSL